jgi:hypothetical protein
MTCVDASDRECDRPSGAREEVTAFVSWRPDSVHAYLSNAQSKYSITAERDGREVDELVAWLANSPEKPAYVDLYLFEEDATHASLLDSLDRAGWQVRVTRYVFPGSRSQVFDGVWARIWVGGAGWVEGEFSVGGEPVSILASSVLDNGWQDLLDALTELAQGSVNAQASWWEEPWYARFRFTRVDPDRVRVVIVREYEEDAADEILERVLLDAEVSVVSFVSAIAETSRALLDGYPHAELGAAWRTEAYLPIASQERLEAALAQLEGGVSA